MPTPMNSWFDVSSLRLVDSRWEYVPSAVTFESASKGAAVLREFGRQGRHIAGLRVWMSDSAWRIEITPEGDPRVACRGLGIILDQLIQEVGVEQVPRDLFFETRESLFLARGLLSLWPLSCAERRAEILAHHTLVHCPQDTNEDWASYEKQAVQFVANDLHGFTELEPDVLQIKNVGASPDGLFFKEDEGQLVIVEAKMSRPDWGDGAAQVLQYIGQARNHSRFRQCNISTRLVVPKDEPSEGYRVWESLMRHDRDFRIYIDASCLAFNAFAQDGPLARSA